MAQIKTRKRTHARRKGRTDGSGKGKPQELQRVKDFISGKLSRAGYKTVTEIAHANSMRMAEGTGLKVHQTEKLISSAKKVYNVLSTRQSSRKNGARPERGQTVNGIIISEAIKNKEFRKKVIHHIVDNLS